MIMSCFDFFFSFSFSKHVLMNLEQMNKKSETENDFGKKNMFEMEDAVWWTV